MSYIIPIIAGLLSGLIGAMGFGGGGVLIIYLVIFASTPQIVAQGINLIFFIPCALLATIIYSAKKQIRFKIILPVILGGVMGAISGSYALNYIETKYLSMLFGGFLVLMGLVNIKSKIFPCK